MKPEQILKKAIEQAVENGFICIENMPPIHISNLIEDNLYYSVIFSHDFLKAFFGEEEISEGCGQCGLQWGGKPAWQYHAQQMVLEEDPIKYLEKYLN